MTAAAVVLVAFALVTSASCASDADPEVDDSGTTASTQFAPGRSGAFAVADTPAGYEIARAYSDSQSDQRSVHYAQDGDEDLPGWTVSAASWTDDQPTFDEVFAWVEERGDEDGVTKVEVHGQRAFLGPYTSDGQVVGRQIIWEERPGFGVGITIRDGVDVDPVALAESTYEISEEAFEALRLGTGGGGEPGARIQVSSGEVEGDPWMLTAVLPEGYPLEPIDRRAGCVELTYRSESASTCEGVWAFQPLDDGGQAVLGGVNFAFGVFRDGEADVLIAPVETPDGPWEHADATVVPEAPDMTFFVLSFPRVCDRVAYSKAGVFQPVGVTEGHPRSKCD